MSDPTFVDPAAPSASDRFGDLLAFLDLFKNRDAIEAAARQLRELEIRIAVARENLAEAKAEHGDLDARASMLDRRAAELRLLEREQTAKFDDARLELVAQHRRLVEIESAIKLRLLRHADALGGFDARLQSVPEWSAIDRLAGAPVDVVEEMRPPSMQTTREGWGDDKFSDQSTLTRSVPMSEHDDLPMPQRPDASARSRRRRGAERRVTP
jgi:hypothetical protein